MPDPYFISYGTSASTDVVLRLGDDLLGGQPSLPVWIACRHIPAGADWDDSIRDALSRCKALIFVMSPDALQRDVCKGEWTRALRNKKPVVPIVHQPFDDDLLPLRMEYRQRIDFSNPDHP